MTWFSQNQRKIDFHIDELVLTVELLGYTFEVSSTATIKGRVMGAVPAGKPQKRKSEHPLIGGFAILILFLIIISVLL
jgi:hypothetical protein